MAGLGAPSPPAHLPAAAASVLRPGGGPAQAQAEGSPSRRGRAADGHRRPGEALDGWPRAHSFPSLLVVRGGRHSCLSVHAWSLMPEPGQGRKCLLEGGGKQEVEDRHRSPRGCLPLLVGGGGSCWARCAGHGKACRSVVVTSGPVGLAGAPVPLGSAGPQAGPPTPPGHLCPTFLILASDPGLWPGPAGRQRDDWICDDPVVPGS